ncbi:Csc1-like protein erd4, partial [Thalictrum thalictroides]
MLSYFHYFDRQTELDFLTLLFFRIFIGYGLELSRLVPLIIFHLKKKYICKTEAEVNEAWAPGDINYATRVPNDLLIATIVLCYSVIAPVIIPFGVAYFGVGWLVLRNQALKVYVPSYESYGRMWPHMHARILAALIIYQVTMVGYFSIKQFLYSPLVIPLPALSIAFGLMCRQKFYYSFRNTPLEVACAEMKETPNLEAIYKAYIPPCLSSDKFDEAQEFGDALSAVPKTGKPGNMVIYYPIWINKGLLPPYDVRTRSPFAWIKESFTSTEEKIISNSGVDTAVYFVFLSTVLKIMVSSGTFLLPSLLPIAWTANGIFVKVNCFKINSNISNLERFSMANVEEKSPRLWAFLLATYVVSFTTFYMLWKAYNHVSELRGTALSALDVIMPEQYAIVVRDIPAVPKTQKDRKEQVDSYFKSLYADEFYDSLVITDNTE